MIDYLEFIIYSFVKRSPLTLAYSTPVSTSHSEMCLLLFYPRLAQQISLEWFVLQLVQNVQI